MSRFEPLLAVIVTAATSTVSAFSAILATTLGVIPEISQTLNDPTSTVILDDGKMRIVCVIGAVCGSLLSALILTPPKANGVVFARKVVASQISGVVFTPILFHWCKWIPTVDTLIAVSAVVSMLSVGVIRVAVPVWTKIAIKYLGAHPSDEDNQRPPQG